jgi:hypothetical protein
MRGGIGVIVGPLVGGAIAAVIVLIVVPALPAHRHPDPAGYPVECTSNGKRCYERNKRVRNPTSGGEQRRCRRYGARHQTARSQKATEFRWHPLFSPAVGTAHRMTFICAPPSVVIAPASEAGNR